ncbi:MAG: SUMF1/EgtB/PvdO family nonheme iron enzyme [Deltaproteobacteria bacterium]|nr:SUMF1/EgtB/PvdO family nonheme iron enzyme [Deltaproteobacteria bacterium]MBW2536956.1 SUMF1/EgtB/PvdO family nonheme iron enzyme [Deltaproteobacteria bacterium]
MALSAGTMVTPNVRLTRLLGEGGMGSVWVAEHLTLDTQVAVKFISTQSFGKAGRTQLARFRREAKAAVKIRSPHVVQIFDYGIMDDGSPYIVMELLEGETFGARLKRLGAVGPEMTAEIMAQVSKALSAAHHLGIVHRDIKPDNIYLTKTHDGELMVKVLDFGVAKQSGMGIDQDITSTGSLIGSPKYMSPEQLLSHKDVGPSADMWALAVVAYRGITGVAPFRGPTLAALSIAICNSEYRPPSELRPDLSSAVDQWFTRAFQRDPDQRFESLKELVSSFRAAFHDGVDPLSDSSASLSFSLPHVSDSIAQPALAPPAGAAAPPTPVAHQQPPPPAAALEPPQAAPPVPEPPYEPAAPAPMDQAPTLAIPRGEVAPYVSPDDSSSHPALPVPEVPPHRPPADSGVDLTPSSQDGVHPVVQQADPGSLSESGSMASIGGASASLQPPLTMTDRQRLMVLGVLGAIGATILLILVVALSWDDETTEEVAKTLATAEVGLVKRDLASAAGRKLAPVPEGMVAVPAGTYPIGCDAEQGSGCFGDEQPRHEVDLGRFGIMRHEVTVGDFGKCVAAGKCDKPGTGERCTWRQSGKTALPITCVTWTAAQKYCAFRGWRLPTEAEWEVAARGAAAKTFPWGEARPNCGRSAVGGPGGCGLRGPLAVGSKTSDRSWAGALDLGGNVREWTSSDYAAYPGGKSESDRAGKITRGSSWSIPAADADSSYNRGVDKPDQSRPDLGFRCATSL